MGTMRQRILVVDDDPSLAEMLTIVLRGEGFDTAVIGDGSQALTAVRELRPDLVLLDLMLPGELSGTQVLEKIRNDHGGDAKVLVVSALVNATTTPKLEAYGNVQTLAKPFKIKELASRIQSMLAA